MIIINLFEFDEPPKIDFITIIRLKKVQLLSYISCSSLLLLARLLLALKSVTHSVDRFEANAINMSIVEDIKLSATCEAWRRDTRRVER